MMPHDGCCARKSHDLLARRRRFLCNRSISLLSAGKFYQNCAMCVVWEFSIFKLQITHCSYLVFVLCSVFYFNFTHVVHISLVSQYAFCCTKSLYRVGNLTPYSVCIFFILKCTCIIFGFLFGKFFILLSLRLVR